MEIYKVLHYAHVLLKKKSTPVTKFTDQLREFVKNLVTTAHAFEGGGIASPQVGVNKRIFIGDYTLAFEGKRGFEKKENDFLVFDKDGNKIDVKFPMIFINPEIVEKSDPITTNWEGCLSFPDAESFEIPRFNTILLRAQNEFGEFFTVKTTHLYAAVNFQHEVDHLDGILMIDHWNKKDYSEKDIVAAIKDHGDDPKERKRIKKLKLIDANKINFDFI
ncbi:MAG: peptide deformylase [Bdellovibrionota bacterium]